MAFDLFGTLVTAPTPQERARAASQLGSVIGKDTEIVDDYFRNTWHVRHDGTLPTVRDLAAHLIRAVDGPEETITPVADELRALAQVRLVPAPTVVGALRSLRDKGLRLGVLSDASADIADAWPRSPMTALADTAIFSCQSGVTKPDQRLYGRLLGKLSVGARHTLYVGDGGGDELRGALAAGMAAVAVRRRGPADALAFGAADWPGHVLDAVERVPSYLGEQA